MASLKITVCLPPPVVNVQAAISDALKPFELWRNENSLDRWKWDRWRISCDHGNAGFRIAAGFEHHPALVRGNDPCEPGWCAGGPRFALDLDGRREEAAFEPGLALDRAEYVAWQRDRAMRPGGLLTLDGWWWEPGEPPVHGACESLASCPHRLEISSIDEYLDGPLPHDAVVVALICHV